MLEGTNIVLDENNFGKFSVKTYLNLCEKETENHGVDLYHGVVEFVDNETNTPLTVKPIINREDDAMHGHFQDTPEAREHIAGEMSEVVDMIRKSIAENGEDSFFEALKTAAEIETAVIAAAQTNPAIMLMLSAGLSPLDIFNMITDAKDVAQKDEAEGPDVPLLGGFTI
jgi:hypothetical protein